MFKWSRQDGAFDLKRLRTNGSSLSLSSVSRSDSGILNIAASNAEGVSETQIKLNVKCKRFSSFFHFFHSLSLPHSHFFFSISPDMGRDMGADFLSLPESQVSCL